MKTREITTSFVSEVQNGYICQAMVKDESGISASMVAEGKTVHEACNIALGNTMKELSKIIEQTGKNDYFLPATSGGSFSRSSSPQRTQANKSTLNGGGNKPVSSNQKTLIQRIAAEKGQSAETLSSNMYGKELSSLTGEEANILIRELKR